MIDPLNWSADLALASATIAGHKSPHPSNTVALGLFFIVRLTDSCFTVYALSPTTAYLSRATAP